ncbi:MAG: 30S ribosomal protein S16 [Candidatus Omnitrophica bacterium]|nr:30S ribosomal protein S16 [Candidatus Omnitrophota bacterium]
MVRVRLKRVGTNKRLQWRVVVADIRMPRDGKFIENLGYYDPNCEPAKIKIDEARLKQWVSKGAQVSESVKSLVKRMKKRKA